MNNDYIGMTVTIKLKSYEFQSICQLINKIQESDKNLKDCIELNLEEKRTVFSVFKKLAVAGKRKAEKLENIGQEFRTSIEFGSFNH